MTPPKRELRLAQPFLPAAHAPKATISAIEITRHRLFFDPPFHASWDTKPRAFWDAAIVAVHTDLGVTGYGSGDMMLGFEGHEPLFVGEDPLRLERHWRILNNISFHGGAAGRSTSRYGTSPASTPASPAGN
jgi:L-alanine-DL-glutamate epimerase-like enolase superfamily enzyme